MTTAEPVARLLASLDNVKPNGTGHTARCPGHDDRHNSLTVGTGEDGQALIHCHAGCEPERVVAALGWRLADLYPPRAETIPQNGHGRLPVANYDYHDEDGTLLYQVVRFEPKDFRQRRPDGNGGWVWNLKETRRVLYRLPALLAADPSAWVFIPEGEKDVERLVALGFVATTNAQGAGKWRPEYTAALKGRHVALVPDNDEPGERHAQAVAASLSGIAAEVRIVRLPGLLPKGDVSDWLDAGHDGGTLPQLIEATAPWEPNAQEPPVQPCRRVRFMTAREFAEQTPDHTAWVAEPYVPVGGIVKVDGPPKKAGKTTFITHMVRAILDGSDFLGRSTTRGPVVLLSEQGGTSLREALHRAGLLERDHLYLALYRDMAGVAWPDVVADAVSLAVEVGAVLLVVDTLPACSGVRGDDENSAGRALEALEPLQVAADTHRLGVVVSFHDRKGGGEVGDSGRGSTAYAGAVDIILHITKPGGNFSPTIRKIEALSRFEATPPELYVELTDTGYVSLGSQDDVVSAALARALPDVLPDAEEAAKRIESVKDKETEEIVERGLRDDLAAAGVQVARSTLDAELKRWIAGGYVGQTGGAKRGSPKRYWLVVMPPDGFFRSKPWGASEESIYNKDAAEAPSAPESNQAQPMYSSDAPYPSEESIEEIRTAANADPILSSDAPYAYCGRNNGTEGPGSLGFGHPGAAGMNAIALLDDLRDAGIRLVRSETGLGADVLPGVDLDTHREAIAAHKPALLAVLDVQGRIVAAATVDPEHFDRAAYDALWAEWHALQEETP